MANMGRTPVDEIFERCMTARRTESRSVEDCLMLYPVERKELEPLLRLAARLETAHTLRPAAEFKAGAVQRLANLAAAHPVPQQQGRGWLPRWAAGVRDPARVNTRPAFNPLIAGLLVLALIMCSFGAASASVQALPGDFLYPVKRAQETVQLALTLDAAGRAGLHLEFANRRIAEAITLVQENRTQALEQAVADYNEQIQSELALLQADSRLSGVQQMALAGRLFDETQRQAASLAILNQSAPPKLQARIVIALNSSQQAYDLAAKILQNTPGSGPFPATPPPGKPTPTVPPAPGPTSTLPRPTGSATPKPAPGSLPPGLPTPTPPPNVTPPAGFLTPVLPTRVTPPPGSVLPTRGSPTPGTGNIATPKSTLPPKPTPTVPPAIGPINRPTPTQPAPSGGFFPTATRKP